jgi:hypothetical protein
MSSLRRYAAAISHLGPRQTALNLLHRARQRTRRFERYRRTGRGLEWTGRKATSFVTHDGSAARGGALHGSARRWRSATLRAGRPTLLYSGSSTSTTSAGSEALPAAEQQRLVLDWVERYAPSGRRPGWKPYPLSLRLRHWARAVLDARIGAGAGRAPLLASLEAQGDCLSDTLEYHLRGNHLLESALTLGILAACVRGPAVSRWARRAEGVLDAELAEQFLPDGAT